LTGNSTATFAAWSYGVAAFVYIAFAVRMLVGSTSNPRARLLRSAIAATALWATAGIIVAAAESPGTWAVSNVADALRYAAWFLFMRALLQDKPLGHASGAAPNFVRHWSIGLVAIALAASLAISFGLDLPGLNGAGSQRMEFGLRLGLAVFGLTLVEQLIRRARPHSSWAIKPLCVALGGIFAFDLFFYADAMLYGRIEADIWATRGIASAIVVPFIAIATARNTGWTVNLHLSRDVVVQSTTLLISGVFVLAVAAAGYFVRYVGGDWGRALQIELLFATLLCGVLVAWSGSFRAKVRVFVSKHFFSYRYDYRAEWLRFTRMLSTEGTAQGIKESAIIALANLVESPAGLLWVRDERGYQPGARWNLPALEAIEPDEGSLASFLARTGWVIDLKQVAADPGRYEGLDLALSPWLLAIPDAWLLIPLSSGDDLLGFVLLTNARTSIEVDWEVRDLLKTASRQAASYLGQLRATEALLEARKFDAFNRMSAFVVHDLKNLVAQLSLMLRNAERHHNNPEFQRDMLSTIENVVGRMNKLMLQLRTGATPAESPRPIELGPVVRRVCTAKGSQTAPVGMALTSGVVAVAHEERLEHVIGHLVQNALDATVTRGNVSVQLRRDERNAVLEVVDTGVGMSPEFVRQRLFRPFETTKTAGMGIGVYESSQYVVGLGGQLLVDSTPGVGTRVSVLLPLADGASAAAAPMTEAA
jgi:putative PEP-CTERM system histidine kinase